MEHTKLYTVFDIARIWTKHKLQLGARTTFENQKRNATCRTEIYWTMRNSSRGAGNHNKPTVPWKLIHHPQTTYRIFTSSGSLLTWKNKIKNEKCERGNSRSYIIRNSFPIELNWTSGHTPANKPWQHQSINQSTIEPRNNCANEQTILPTKTNVN